MKSYGVLMYLKRVATFVVVAAVSAASLLTVVSAQTDPSDSITLGVSPQILDLTANPGERLTNTFRLTNASDDSVSIRTIPKNFTPRGEEGAVDLTEDRTAFSLAEWISVTPETTTIAAKATQDFVVLIDVPDDVEPGSHFGSVVFATVPPEQEGAGAVVSQEIAPIILVRVAGDVVESAEISEFRAEKEFYSSDEDSITFLSRIQNTGTVHFQPTGRITIKNMFGREVKTLDLEKRNVLPDSIRQISTQWSLDGFRLGRYTAELTLVYGDSVEIRTATTSFTVIPYQTLVPIIVVGGVLSALVYRGRQRLLRATRALIGKDEPSGK